MNPVIKGVYLEQDRLYIIDQRLLPLQEKVIELKTVTDVYNAIKSLAVRGAPAIGITAAYGVYTGMKEKHSAEPEAFIKGAQEVIHYLAGSRPTAYNLFYALERMNGVLDPAQSSAGMLETLKTEALKIHQEDLEKSSRISQFGLPIIPNGARIISHCNAGFIATGGGGTSLGVVHRAHQEGRNVSVYVDETRPLLQGTRLTAWELEKTGVPYQIIADNMAASLMKDRKVDLVILGADRIASNGDFANKIGTYSLAVLAKYHGIPFYAAAPVSTFDFSLKDGGGIPIEERDEEEILSFAGTRISPKNARAYNPAFDVTPHELLTGIITEYGIIYPPFRENILELPGRADSPK